ncbi:disease resistance protein (TIR-NBS-LRR class) [Trifolium pratense]|uniref:Disease resistance protein (TIR-NBS-LRR class) n=1 Tax=Trifolium pratense TaxID=57577 RepID=A0A2K3NZE2_TRIPR|nr:disease resistance protein (TIR-NBS-LRR class) [Trifolium pratense]
MPLQIKHLVGLDSRFEQVKSLIDIDSDDTVYFFGIYGAGGIGKTTFALDIYNKIRHRFEAASFLANVREKSKERTRGLEDLQKTLLYVISYAKGIPLALRVIGSNLKGKSIEEWDIEIQRYRMVPDAEIQEMHDLIQDMGREIVRKESASNPGERSRLWSHKDVLNVLKGNLGSTAVEGIMLQPPKQEKVDHWDYTSFAKMKNLRILIVRNTLFSLGPSYFPNTLRLLDWKCYPSKDFPPTFYPYRIVDFKLPHSSMILKKPFQVSQEIQRTKVVMPMPKREIPEWFDCASTQEIPVLWARRKFPVFALALVFGEVKEGGYFYKFVEAVNLLTGVRDWHTVSLHLFIDGQEICSRDFHYFNVGEDHVLLCDLRVLFSDDEWQELDASLGDDWKIIQVQYDSDLILTNWGVYVYKQETSMDDIEFITPNHNSVSYMSSSSLVPKAYPDQHMKHLLESLNPRNMFNEYLPLLESEESIVMSLNVILRSLRNAKAEVIEKTSSSTYGASLKQDHEDSAEDVIQVVEMIKQNFLEHFIDLSPEDLQIASLAAERILRAQVELMEENSLDIGMPIILEYTYAPGATHRRFWGTVEKKLGDPFYKPVFKRQNQLSLELGISDLRVIIVELKCQTAGEEEAPSSSLEESLEDVNYDPELEELLTMIEQDAMRFNKSYGKMKASIVKTVEPISESYLLETLICMRLMTSGNLTMFGSATKFKITPYGKMRAEDEPFRIPRKCFWGYQ